MYQFKASMETLAGQPIPTVACSLSSYDENTLRVAEDPGVRYVLARVSEDVRTLFYRPEGKVRDKFMMLHNAEGPMYHEVATFIADLKYRLAEHLAGEHSFLPILESYRAR